MSTCRKLRVTSRLPSSRPDDVTTPSFWCLSVLLHTVFIWQAQSVIYNCAFCCYESLLFYDSVSQTAGQWTPVSTYPRNQFPMQTSGYNPSRSLLLSHPRSASIRPVIVESVSRAESPTILSHWRLCPRTDHALPPQPLDRFTGSGAVLLYLW